LTTNAERIHGSAGLTNQQKMPTSLDGASYWQFVASLENTENMSYYTDLDNDLGADYEARQHMRDHEAKRLSKKREFDAAVARQVKIELAKLKIKQTQKSTAYHAPRGLMVDVQCKCGDIFQARKADRDRGWGRYCSKSCKAKFSR
jgi:hypothetical protein